MRLTVQIVVFEGGLPFGPTIGRGDGLRGNHHGYRRRRGDGFSWVGKKTGAVLLEKVISGSGEKAYWLISKKSDFFEAPGIISAKISQSGSFLEKIIISTCWGKNPEIWAFCSPAKKVVLAHFQKKFGFYLPGNRRRNLCVFFPRPPRSRYKARCNHIRDLLRDETFFAVDAVCYGSACYFSVFSWSPLFTFFRLVCDLRPTVHTVVFLAATYRSRCF